MNKALACAKREDMEAMVAGVGEQEDVNTHTELESAKWMGIIREKYQGVVIRRTADSLDYQGESITGLLPYKDHLCVLEMHKQEYKALERLVERPMESEMFVRWFASEVSQRISLFSLRIS